jgi:hypothetical protein
MFLTYFGMSGDMEDISNVSIGNRKRKSIGSSGKENVPAVDLEIIDQPTSFDFDLRINLAINRGSLKYT